MGKPFEVPVFAEPAKAVSRAIDWSYAEYMDEVSDLFRDEVDKNELLDQYVRNLIPEAEFHARIRQLKLECIDRGHESLDQKAEEDRYANSADAAGA